MRLDTVIGFLLWWALGVFASYFLLLFYESVRPYDATIKQNEEDKKQIRKTMGKLAIQAGLIFAVIWFVVRVNSALR
jgi:hypothetical protein